MNEKIAFAGHCEFRISNAEMVNRIIYAIKEEIKNGNFFYTMGTYGNFDKLALSCCRELRKEYKNLKIEVVITSLNQIKPKFIFNNLWGEEKFVPYQDVSTILYDVEEIYFKNRIIKSNQNMIDNCDTLICYINTKKHGSGAKRTYNYAKRKGLKIINLFKKEDDPYYFMNKEEQKKYLDHFYKNLLEELNKNKKNEK